MHGRGPSQSDAGSRRDQSRAAHLGTRDRRALSLKEAAEKLGPAISARGSAAEKLRKLEAGEQPVSETRLQKASAVYRRPLVSFYLPRPPERGERGEDFRTTAAAVSTRDNALLDALMRDVRARQQLVRELLIEEVINAGTWVNRRSSPGSRARADHRVRH